MFNSFNECNILLTFTNLQNKWQVRANAYTKAKALFSYFSENICSPLGDAGFKGDAGHPGLPGLEGHKGDSGRPGEDGRPGLPGLDGQRGIPGEPGNDGLSGLSGEDMSNSHT